MSRNSERQDVPESMPVQQKQEELPNLPKPTFIVDLPSKGKFYQKGSTLAGKSYLELYHLTGKHEDILNNKDFLKKNIVMDKLLSALIVDKSVNLDDLLVGDKAALIFGARINGFDAEYEVEVECPECNKKSNYEFDLQRSLDTVVGAADKIDDVGHFELTLPKTGKKAVCRLITAGQQKDLDFQIEKEKKLFQEDHTSTLTLVKQLVSIDGNDDEEVIRAVVEDLPAKDNRFLRKACAEMTPSIDMTQDFSCPKCSEVSKVVIPFSVGFFWG